MRLNEFAPSNNGRDDRPKYLPWNEFIGDLEAILGDHFSVVQNIVKSTIKARFVPHDPMEFGPTMLYSYYETRAGRVKGAISTRGSIQVGKYTEGGITGQEKGKLLTTFSLLKGTPFERHFDLTGENVQKIADIIIGNTAGAYQMPEQVNEFAPASNPGGGNYLKALASAWYNGTFNTGDLHRGIKSQEDVERVLERGIHCGDGKVRKYSIGYNADFDGVLITSEDYYNYTDYDNAGNEVDERTGKPWGPYEYVEFHDRDLDESQLNEFAPGSGDDRENDPEDVLFRFAKLWYSAPDVATQRRVEQALAKVGWEIGELESEEGGAFVMRVGDDTGDSYIGWSEEQLADQLNELSFLGSQCTKDCSGHRAGYEWSARKGNVHAASWSPSFNKGAALRVAGK